MKRVPTLAAALVLAACNSSSGAPDAPPECVRSDGSYVCPAATEVACPAGSGQPCDYSIVNCLGCSGGEGLGCICADAGQAEGGRWSCVDNGLTCQ